MDTYTKTDLLRTERGIQTVSSRELQNMEVPISPEGRGGFHGYKHAQLEELFKQVALL